MSVTQLNGQLSAMGSSVRGLTLAATSSSSSTSAATVSQHIGGMSFGGSGDTCSSLNTLSGASNPFNHFSSSSMDMEFQQLFEGNAWDQLDGSASWPGGPDRPESRNSGAANSRPPSQPQSSPSSQHSSNFPPSNSNNAATNCSPLGRDYSPTRANLAHQNAAQSFNNSSFPFSPMQDSQPGTAASAGMSANGGGKRHEDPTKAAGATSNSGAVDRQSPGIARTATPTAATDGPHHHQRNSSSVVPMEPSGRLRNLLIKGNVVPNASGGSGAGDDNNHEGMSNDDENKHKILKTLLNQQDEDEYGAKMRISPGNSGSKAMQPKTPGSEQSKQPSSVTNNMMLLQVII